MVDQIPGTVILNLSDLDRIATTAALAAAKAVHDQERLTEDDVEDIVEKANARFCERLGLPTERPDVEKWRRNMNALEAMVDTQRALKEHGLKALVGMFVVGIGTAVWLAFTMKMGGK